MGMHGEGFEVVMVGLSSGLGAESHFELRHL